MTESSAHNWPLPPEQQAIRDKCFHPSGKFVEFPIEDVETSIPARFERIVRLHANRIAVKTENRVATYSKLNDMANRFACALLQAQGRRAQPVALLLEKDVAQVAAMLGAMKAGKFFLILDPSFPKHRLAAMLKGSRAKLVVTNRRNASLADEIATPDCELIQWETIGDSISADNPEISIAPKALAFINYTSGSTGEPKGLLRTHRMILHNIMLRTNLIHVCEHDRISLLSSGTSNAITNSLLALINGAGLYSLEVKKEGVVRLARWLTEENITIALMSSPLFRGLCETLKEKNNFPDLRVIRLRSEAVYRSDVELYKKYFSPSCIFATGLSSNETGPLADYLIDHDSILSDSAIPVGYVAPGKNVVLLDQDGERIGFDEVGEIAVRSRYLSPGYLRNPKLTKAKFKCDRTATGSRMYLTGDMALMFPNGCLMHKGRKDFRVKVRGYPVDIKEVEIALRAHPSMHDAVIMARHNPSGETTLVAYFVTASEQALTVSELVKFLAQTLPDYMIPAAFVRLNKMPLNPQNKVDRAALPSPCETRPDLDTPFMAPRGDEERQVAEIWAEVLGIDRVGIQDNFLELGGHSLAATRIVTRVIEKFHLELPVQVLFDSPTVEKMALVIMANQTFGHKLGELRAPRFGEGVAALRDKCVYPSENFVEFPIEEIETSIPARFEKIVEMYPDRLAVKSGVRSYTYDELNRAANRIAHAIVLRRGADSEMVALEFEHGIDAIVAVLGALKAGKYFVSLDPSLPHERSAYILADSQANLIVTNKRNAEVARNLAGGHSAWLNIDEISGSALSDNLGVGLSPDDLAIMTYTSGSTGKPKGVVRAHRSFLHSFVINANEMRICRNDRLTLFHSISFSSAYTHLLTSLLSGASLFPFDIKSEGAHHVANWLQEEQITVCHLPLSVFRQIAGSLADRKTSSRLRLLRLSGAPIINQDFEFYKQSFPPQTLLSIAMGSTETRGICCATVDHSFSFPTEGTPVGYPRPGKEILLLDENGQKVGAGDVGEIAVKDRNLSPGYWRKPGLTNSKFLADSSGGDERIYLTGDLGRMLPDGFLIHLGRKDFQVKIRGYRVELGEIEQALLSHPQIREAVVAAWDQDDGEKELAAYIVPSESPPNASDLRAFLTRSLPNYMIPSTFVKLETIPLTPNGKIDRRALPDAGVHRPDLNVSYVAPGSDEERAVSKIFAECTGIQQVGTQDNFFELGGDSLTIARVLSRLNETFRRQFSMQELFDAPSVAGIVSLLKSSPQPVATTAKPLLLVSSNTQPSFSQQRLWFLDQLDPGSFTHNLVSAYRLKGNLNIAALEQSVNEIIRRHDVLRTVFKAEDGNPGQVILPNLVIKILLLDLGGGGSADGQWTQVRRLIKEEAQRPFDLATGPLLRFTLLQLGTDDYVLLRTMHHIVSDGWSEGVLAFELAEIYQAVLLGKASPLADLPIQYANYAKWQRDWLTGDRFKSQLSYWKKQLDKIETLNLPTDHRRGAFSARRGGRRRYALSEQLTSQLKNFSREHGATLFMTLVAAFQTLLHRYSNQTDIAIGTPIAGRNLREFEGLIGFFLNMLVLRLDLSGNPTFTEVLGRAREMCLGALSHQELPFEKLVEEMHPDRSLTHNPLFQVAFAFQNTPRVPPQLSGITVDELEVETGIARFDLHLFMEETGGHIEGYCNYDSNLFNADTIERMVGHFQTLLEGIVEDPDCRIAALPLLSETEKKQILVDWNETKRDYPKDRCVHELFEIQVEKTPDAIALAFEGQQLSYRGLNERANRLAHYLRKLGIGPEILVGICIERSLEMIVGLLGILKAGGAYVPLDLSYPAERLNFMLAEAQVSVLLTQGELFKDGRSRIDDGERFWPIDLRLQVVRLDRDWQLIAKESGANLDHTATAENLAYVIYTSGSTGEPRGVAVPHRAVNRLVLNTDYVQVTSSEVVAQASNVSFDAATFEIWGSLLNGARLELIAKDTLLSPQCLSTAIERQGITTLFLTTALFNRMVEHIPAALGRLRYLLFGGEAVDPERVRDLLRNGPPTRLLHVYGPTETTTFATWHCATAVAAEATTVPIGRPIANTEIYILDADLNPVPIGVSGELYIGGDGLADGYLNRRELTQEKFIANPFSNEPGARLYKSGDLARYLRDGNIEFLGRVDNQVKIRGHRIEPGEIEATLGRHLSVRESVVLAREDTPGDRYLVAYVVAVNGYTPSVTELRSFVQQMLPEYMVPSAFVFLDRLPLTLNGKVDRKALPAPDPSRPQLEETYTAPRTSTEEKLVNIWAEVLKLDKVGINDNFFELGGHSLLAIQLISRIRDAFMLDLPLRSLFEAPTIAGIAARMTSTGGGVAQTGIMSIMPKSSLTDYPVSFSQERFWFLEEFQPNNPAFKVTFAFQVVGPLNIAALEESLAEIVRRHESLRTTLHESDGALFQRIGEPRSFRLNLINVQQDKSLDLQTIVETLLEQESRCPFNLSTDLLLRASVFRLNDREHILSVCSHHLAWDHWSIAIFVRELAVLYRAFAVGKPSPLTELPIQYRHYALWQRETFQLSKFGHHLAYWKSQLKNAPPSINFPTDHPRQPLHHRRGGRQILMLPKKLKSSLDALSNKTGTTSFMTFLAAFQVLLHRITGEDDIVVGAPVAGRNRSETEGLIGLFLNSLALRTNLSGNPTFLELLARVREVTLAAYEHQEFPFERLVEALQPQRDLTTTPIFQVFINMYNFKEEEFYLDGLSVSRISTPVESAPQFDLAFHIREYEDHTLLRFVYDSDLFEASTIERMIGHFQTLLEGIVRNPEQRISELPWLTEAEKRQLFIEWNDTQRDYPKDQCVHQMFETQVEGTPDAVAVVFEDQKLTYRELNSRANQLAHYLRCFGVGPEVVVGLCMERSIDMIVGLLGILKAGGAYVPLDPSYPQERLAFMIEDAKVKVLLTQQQFLSGIHHSCVVRLDKDWQNIATQSSLNPPSTTTSHNLAYVIYTSGTTGKPKGVMAQHGSVVNFLASMAREPGLSETDILLSVTTLSFDIAGLEIYLPLSVGARVVLACREVATDALRLTQLLSDSGVTAMQATPATWRMLLASGWQGSRGLKVLCGGEALSEDLAKQLVQRCASLWNMYGPTEATIWSTVQKVAADVDRITLGRPIANTQIYILDQHLNPVPVGVQGELHISGDGLARGYLNRPELSREKFIADPFHPNADRRLYRTGDLARYLPDGNIEFLGRMDDQVKVRGYRVELGEIEAVLGQHPAVRNSVVVLRKDSPGDQHLVGYVVAHQRDSLDTTEIRKYLKQKLPEYMIPSVFVLLDELPLTPNGKVDRKGLPAPDQSRPDLGIYQAPRTPIEESIAAVWVEVLKVDKIGIYDNFFELGGHSLLATRVIFRLRDVFQVDLPLRCLFETPTIHGLARRAQELGEKRETRSKKRIVPAVRERYLVQSRILEKQ